MPWRKLRSSRRKMRDCSRNWRWSLQLTSWFAGQRRWRRILKLRDGVGRDQEKDGTAPNAVRKLQRNLDLDDLIFSSGASYGSKRKTATKKDGAFQGEVSNIKDRDDECVVPSNLNGNTLVVLENPKEGDLFVEQMQRKVVECSNGAGARL